MGFGRRFIVFMIKTILTLVAASFLIIPPQPEPTVGGMQLSFRPIEISRLLSAGWSFLYQAYDLLWLTDHATKCRAALLENLG